MAANQQIIVPNAPKPAEQQTPVLPPVRPVDQGASLPLVVASAGLGLVKPKFFTLPDPDRIAREQSGDEATATSSGEAAKQEYGLLGLPVFDTLTFERFSYTDKNGNKISQAEITFQNVIIELNQPKNIVTTVIQGRDKSVKEYINEGDFIISIKGNLVGLDANKMPVDEIQKIVALKKAPVEIPVSSNFLDQFGIFSIVITDVKYKQIEGTRNVVAIEIEALDEEPFVLKSNA